MHALPSNADAQHILEMAKTEVAIILFPLNIFIKRI
jgi:hypothetical protein